MDTLEKECFQFSNALTLCLGWEGLQKFFKERIWICQEHLHGMLFLWTGGAHVSSMQYALISYDLQLILALMGLSLPKILLGAW